VACNQPQESLFTTLPPQQTGIDFNNELIETDSFNIVVHEYIYNGGGVGVGDFDKNGLPDLFFSGNRVSSELYLQTAPWQFKKVTQPSGLETHVWCAGVSITDIDANGFEDIYLSTLNLTGEKDTPNLLFLNQGPDENGIPHFVEAAKQVGLADSSYCTQATWLDIDLDGDLDLYLLNNGIETFNRNVPRPTDTIGRGKSLDFLYLNQGVTADGLPQFQKMPLGFGIKQEGWGLGVAVHDFNQDQYPDVYVANDFISNDILWLNQAGEGFSNTIASVLPHQSYNSMGVDVADLTNDGHPEIMVVDMLPDDNARIKSMFADINYDRDQLNRLRGFQQQYVRNVLQLNNGDGTFSDMGYLAGVAGTDWSWAPLLFDIDNDGLRDIFVTNGYPKDITDQDFASFNQNATMFGNRAARTQRLTEILKDLGGVHQPNYFFKNLGDLNFIDAGLEWNSQAPTYSNGAVFVDLDLDGDLDIVTNNINSSASVLRNQQRERDPEQSHFLRVKLIGPAKNPQGLGAKLQLNVCESTQYHEHYRVRGYLSTVEQTVHFGVGSITKGCSAKTNELRVTWPDGKVETVYDFVLDQVIEVRYEEASTQASAVVTEVDVSKPHQTISYSETDFNDFNFQYLLQRKYSEEGPHLAKGDLNNDGREDLVIGGPAGQAVRIFLSTPSGGLVLHSTSTLSTTIVPETSALVIFDADLDGDLDLYIGNGSSEFVSAPDLLEDQLFLNDGQATFSLASDALPKLPTFSGAVVTADLEGDGDLDLFLGGRMVPGNFPQIPTSYILRNDQGKFTDVTAEIAPDLRQAGMIAASCWQDFTGDGLADLVIAGDFIGVQLWVNRKGGRLERQTTDLAPIGWWRSLISTDWDNDGDLDLFAGNVGLNGPLRASSAAPVCLYADDFDDNGAIDPIITAYNGAQPYPVHPRNTLTKQLPKFKTQVPNFSSYGKLTADQLPPGSEQLVKICATEFRSGYFENDGQGHFQFIPLPNTAQLAPIRAMELSSNDTLIAVGNDYAYEVLGGRYDAGTGFQLTQTIEGSWQVDRSAISATGDVHSLIILNNGAGKTTATIIGSQKGISVYTQ
ncbi:MAG: VCBS repeat-containing protein, partial [Bacteroidota bacterium]